MSNLEDLERRADAQMRTRGLAEQQVAARERVRKAETNGVQSAVPPEEYDYEAAAFETDFEPNADGSFDLPNKFVKNPQPLAGYDMASGERIWSEPDPNGFGEAGVKRVREGKTNTVNGVPPEVADGYFQLAAQGRQNGRSVDALELPLPADQKDLITGAVSRLDTFDHSEKVLGEIRAQSEGVELDLDPVPEERKVTQETLLGDAEFQASAEAIRAYLDPEGEAMEPEALTAAMVQELAITFMNETKMAELVMDIRSGDMPVEVAQAYHYALGQYDQLSPFDADVMLGTGAGLVTSPLTWLTAGAGKLIYTGATKMAGRAAVMEMLQRYVAARTFKTAGQRQLVAGGVAGMTAGGIESGMWAGFDDMTRQHVNIGTGEQEAVDWDEFASNVKWGVVAGSALGGGLGMWLSKPGREATGRVIRRAIDNASQPGPMPGMPQAQRGAVGVQPTPDAAPDTKFLEVLRGSEVPRGTDMGKAVDPVGFYSRATVNILGDDNLPGRWTQTYGKDENKGIDPEDLLNKIEKWSQGDAGRDIPPISQYELDNMGIPDYLRVKAEAGEKVTRAELEDLMYARAPRFNLGMHSIDTPVPDTMRNVSSASPRQVVDRLASSEPAVRLARNVDVRLVARAAIDDDVAVAHRLGKSDAIVFEDPISQEMVYVSTESGVSPQEAVMNRIKMAVKQLPRESQIKLAQDMDEKMLLPSHPLNGVDYMEYSLGHKSRELHPDNYRELRMFVPTSGRNVDEIAMDRWGKSYDELPQNLQARADRTAELYYDAPAYHETQHWPLDLNRISSIRMQDVYNNATGERILFVNEMQADLHNAVMRHAPDKVVDPASKVTAMDELLNVAETISPQFKESLTEMFSRYEAGNLSFDKLRAGYYQTLKNTGNKSLIKHGHQKFIKAEKAWRKQSERQPYVPTKGWHMAALQQIVELARKEGYSSFSLPRTAAQVRDIQRWEPGIKSERVIHFYEVVLPSLLEKKAVRKRLGIKDVEDGVSIRGDEYDWDTGLSDDTVRTYILDPSIGPASATEKKPIYGAIAAPGGTTMLGGEEED